MRIIFAGTPEFALEALRALHAAGFDIPLVLTQPDRPAGRGLQMHGSPVGRFAAEHGIALLQPRSLRLDGRFPEEAGAAHERLRAARADAMVVAAYGLILPQSVLDIPARGCINIHASLLPRWRGAAPIHRAIEAGDERTGISIMRMDAGLDTGPVLLAREIAISPSDTAGTLHDRLASLGATLIVEALGRLDALVAQPQGEDEATYAAKIGKHESTIDWSQAAGLLARRVRALNPAPGAATTYGAAIVKIWQAQAAPIASHQPPGTVMRADADGVAIATGDGCLVATELQRAGGKRLAAGEFLRGTPLQVGVVLGAP